MDVPEGPRVSVLHVCVVCVHARGQEACGPGVYYTCRYVACMCTHTALCVYACVSVWCVHFVDMSVVCVSHVYGPVCTCMCVCDYLDMQVSRNTRSSPLPSTGDTPGTHFSEEPQGLAEAWLQPDCWDGGCWDGGPLGWGVTGMEGASPAELASPRPRGGLVTQKF